MVISTRKKSISKNEMPPPPPATTASPTKKSEAATSQASKEKETVSKRPAEPVESEPSKLRSTRSRAAKAEDKPPAVAEEETVTSTEPEVSEAVEEAQEPEGEEVNVEQHEETEVAADDQTLEEHPAEEVDQAGGEYTEYVEHHEEEGEVEEHSMVVVEEYSEEGVDEEGEGMETSEIILCVDTSDGDGKLFQVVQPGMFIQKAHQQKELTIREPLIKAGPKSSGPVIIKGSNSGPKMVKLTYGSVSSGQVEKTDEAASAEDDSGNFADESEVVDEVGPRVIQFTTTTASGKQITATSIPIATSSHNTVAILKTDSPTKGQKRTNEVLTLENYSADAEYEVDSSGVVIVRKQQQPVQHHQQFKRKTEQKTSSTLPPKSIACYYCTFRAPTVDEMEQHMNEEHLEEVEDMNGKKRMRKRPRKDAELEVSETDESSAEYQSILDETRESKNPNFQCWRCNNRPFAGSGSLRRHINAVHLRLGNHPCQYCGKLFSAKHNLKVHTATVHLRQRNFVCVFCNRTYTENRSLKRHIESNHSGQKYEAIEIDAQNRKDRIRHRPQYQQIKYIDSSGVIYETEDTENSYDTEEAEQSSLVEHEVSHGGDEGHEADKDQTPADEQTDLQMEVVEESEENAAGTSAGHEVVEGNVVQSADGSEVYIMPHDEKAKTQVVIYHDDSISASEEVVVGGSEMLIANEEVVITNNVDLALEDNGELETIEIKVELNNPSNEIYDQKGQHLVMYETTKSGEELLMSGHEVVVSNEEEVGEHDQVTIHYIKEPTNRRSSAAASAYQITYDEDGNETILSTGSGGGVKRKSYQRIKCGYCGDFFCSRQLFYKHANKVHRDQLVEDWHSCPECRRYFPSVEAVKLHCSLIHANENKKTECPYCTTMFTRTCTYYRHANQAHLDIIAKTWLLCDGCDLYMPDAEKLRQHQVHAHPPRKQK